MEIRQSVNAQPACLDWVVRNQPWHFDKYLFAIKPLLSLEQPSVVTLDRVSLWARVSDIPLAFHTCQVIHYVAERIGILGCYENSDALSPNRFLWFKVNFDITKPLKRGLYVCFRGNPVWIALHYEAFPVFYFCCGVIGHQFRNCKEYDRDAPPDVGVMKFGVRLQILSSRKGLVLLSIQCMILAILDLHSERVPRYMVESQMQLMAPIQALSISHNPIIPSSALILTVTVPSSSTITSLPLSPKSDESAGLVEIASDVSES
ncbi:hypothetical protein ACS0TY_018593 [Phlomoides rotata]